MENYKKLPINAKKYWKLCSFLVSLFLLIPGIISLIVYFNESSYPLLINIMVITFSVLLFVFFAFIYPILRYASYKYYYQDDKIVIKFGVIFKHKLVIPSIQIQDLHVVEGPFLMAYKLGKIIITTGGSNYMLGPIEKDLCLKLVDEFEQNLLTRVKLSMKEDK